MNTLRETDPKASTPGESKPGKTKKQNKLAQRVQKILNGEFLTHEGLINHLPFIGFLTALFLLHIGLMYFYESTERNIVRTQKELNELSAEYKTTASALEMRSQQSQVALDIAMLGLIEVRTPSSIIDVEKGYLEEEN